MTIREFVLFQPNMGINEWLAAIEKANLSLHEKTILECANHYDKITINHNASFIKAINI
jgi:hypothetical protein